MSRCLSTLFIATILVLANFVLISSALLSYDIGELGKKAIFFNEDDIMSQGQATGLLDRERNSHFIGDLTYGEHRDKEVLFVDVLAIANPSSDDASSILTLTVEGTIHFVAVVNQNDSYAVVCATPEILGTSTSILGVRVPANSTAVLAIAIASH